MVVKEYPMEWILKNTGKYNTGCFVIELSKTCLFKVPAIMAKDVETHRDGNIAIEKAGDKTRCSQTQPWLLRSPQNHRDRQPWVVLS